MSRMWTYIIFQPLSAVWNPVYPIHMPPLQILYGKICTKKGEKKMKCPFLESEDMKMNIDKKGNVNCSFSVQGIGISAQVFINMSSGNNTASVSISPNFSNNNLTLNGNIVPLDQSNIFKGRSW